MESTGILINCATLVIHILSFIITLIILTLIIYRFYFNNRYHRHANIYTSTSVFDDNISLILIGNTYLVLLLFSLIWILLSFRTFVGDFTLWKEILYREDSTICRIEVGIVFFLVSALYHSFFLQALSSYFNVKYISKLNTIKIYRISLNSVWLYILMIIFSWMISLFVLIPAFTIIDVFTYFPKQYRCLISFTNIKGFIYSLLVCYLIPMCPIWYIYTQVILYVRQLPRRGLLMRTKREVAVIVYILKTCFAVSLAGMPTSFFLFQFIITGHIHQLADRIHELCLAINTIALTFGFAVLNSLIYMLPQASVTRENNNRIYLQDLDL